MRARRPRHPPASFPLLQRKFDQLKGSGVQLLIGTDSGIPMKFRSDSTWHELEVWVNRLGVPAIDAIRAATYWPAVAMKRDADYGTGTGASTPTSSLSKATRYGTSRCCHGSTSS